jgi:hypothetical protein
MHSKDEIEEATEAQLAELHRELERELSEVTTCDVLELKRRLDAAHEHGRGAITTRHAHEALSAARAALALAGRLLEDAQQCERSQHERAGLCITGAHKLAIDAAAGIERALFPRTMKSRSHGQD